MNDKSVVPEFIASLIDQKRQALEEERRQKEEAEQREQEQQEAQGKAKYQEFLEESLLKVPEWIRTYVALSDVNYVRIGKGWDRVENLDLFFSIPGLAAIAFDPQKANWRAMRANWSPSWDEEPRLEFTNNSYWRSDLEYTLIEAHQAQEEYNQYLHQYAEQREERARRAEKYLQEEAQQAAREGEAQIQKELEQAQEKAEEQALFDAIKHDDIAIHLLKAFVLLRDERSGFEQRIYEMDETMYSIENRWSRRAEELHRQADEAQRRAEDERSRLQSDLEDAEAELKKAQRSQRGW